MEKYRHGGTGVVVEAVRLDKDNVDEVARWSPKAVIVDEKDPFTNELTKALNIETPDGMRRVSQGQYVVKHSTGFFVALPGRFQLTYLPADVPRGHVEPDVREAKILREMDDE